MRVDKQINLIIIEGRRKPKLGSIQRNRKRAVLRWWWKACRKEEERLYESHALHANGP